MALPLPRVIPDTGPGGDIVTAMGGMNALAHNMLKRKFYKPDIMSQINNRNALTEGQNIQNQYMPEKMQLANALSALQNQYYAPNIESEIGNRNALTERNKLMTPLEAQELQLKNQYYPKVTESGIEAQKSLSNWRKTGGASGGVDQKLLMTFENQLSKDHPEWSPEQINAASSAYMLGEDHFPDGTPLPPISGQGSNLLDVMNKKKTTAAGLNQQRYAATAETVLKEGEQYIPSVTKYAGALGKAKGGIDKVMSALGKDTPEYQDYIHFTRVIVPAAASEFMRAMGVNASDTQKKLYMDMVNPITWDTNPATAIKNYKRMMDLLTNVGKTVAKSTSEITSGLKKGGEQTTKKDSSQYDVPEGYIGMFKNGEQYFFPPDQVTKRLNEGYNYE